MNKLDSSIQNQANVSDALANDMFALYAAYYGGTSKDLFISDLRSKDYVVILQDKEQILRGFSTVAVIQTQWEEQPIVALFSGDTIVHHEFWGEQALILQWFELAGRIKTEHTNTPLYWFLIVKGHRTYRMLNVFCKSYIPKPNVLPDDRINGIRDYLAKSRFKDDYCAKTGLIDCVESKGHLLPRWADAHIYQNRNPMVQNFLRLNPEHTRGVELVCLAELTEANLNSYALRGFKKGFYDN